MIRLATKEDIPAILEIYAPYVQNTTYTFEYSVPTVQTFTARFEAITAQFPWLVWEENGIVLGYAYGSAPFERAAYAWCSEVSIYLAPQAQGKGIGTALYACLEEILWRQGYQVIFALITSENQDSVAFHQHVGYSHSFLCKKSGYKFGRWLDVIWMEKRQNFVESPTAAPVPWGYVVENDGKLKNILANFSLS